MPATTTRPTTRGGATGGANRNASAVTVANGHHPIGFRPGAEVIMNGIPAGNPPNGTPPDPNDPRQAGNARPAPSAAMPHQSRTSRRRRLSRAALVAVGIACAVAVLVAAGFVRLTGFVGAVRGLSTPAALVSPAVIDGDAAAWIDANPNHGAANANPAGGVTGAEDLPSTPPRDGAAAPAEPAADTDRRGKPQASPAAGDAAQSPAVGAGWLGGVAGDAGQTIAGIASAAGVGDAQLRPLTILLMGVDARAGEPIDIGVRPDAMALLRLDPETGACRMLAVPRDTRTELPGYGLSKVNHALAVGGVPYQRRVVEGLLGLEIDRFVLVDLRAVEEIVEIVDGVTLDIPEAFVAADGTPIEAGEHTLDGRQVLAYVQYRGGPNGDLGRIGRQQQVLRALLAKASDVDILPTVSRLLPVLEGHLRTDLTPAEIVGLAQRFRGSCTPDSLSVATLDGTIATFDDPLVRQPLSYVVIDETEIAHERALLLAGSAE